MKITAKSCPNCGANLKFNLGDEETKCLYCNSIIKISNNKSDKYVNSKDIIYINKKWEIFKWIMSLLHLPFAVLFAFFLFSRSNPIFSIILVIGGILSIPVIANNVFKSKRILKVIVIELLIVIGFIGSIATIYPIHIVGKLYSNTSNMVIEFKGNNIIIQENGKKMIEKYNIVREQMANNMYYYEIATSKYNFTYSHHKNDMNNINDKFCLVEKYEEIACFYTKKQYDILKDDLFLY